MDFFMGGLEPWAFWLAVAVTLFGGFVKGAVGFAMPMIMISGFGSFMPAELALAALILPTLVTNISQAFRQGPAAAWHSVVAYRRMIAMIALFIIVSAQFVLMIPAAAMYMILGVPIVLFAVTQLMGRNLRFRVEHRARAEYMTGIIGGLYGGISGVWGPPVLVYLISIGAEKAETVRVQGVIFLIGAVVLLLAHLQSGVMNAVTVPFSALLVVPGMLGLWLGYGVQDRLDALRFRRWTLVVLALTGLNLIRRALEI
ncbi:sulfite exporter TauE/SafE family protein [Plastorhodobacter daqingensis]|uniref:Probable membrane transporter protein n=1 Tax=Plastorhodobacter daqingensis TaxID=1387281 RepID=A0ABW2UGL9_9RHOB